MAKHTKSLTILGHIITPEIVKQVIVKGSATQWGTHLLRWRYFEVYYEKMRYHRNALVPTALWHLLKRVYVDGDWPVGTTLDQLNEDARRTIQDSDTEIYLYGYYRTEPPRLQWGFINPKTGIAVVYDYQAELIATVFKPVEGGLFFQSQIAVVKINRKGWKV